MQDYDTDVVIVSVLKYGKDPDKMGTRLDLLLTDSNLCGNNNKFVGSVLVTQWYGSTNVFDDVIKNDLILKVCKAHFVTRKDFKDPTKYSSKVQSLKYKDNVITLLQPDL